MAALSLSYGMWDLVPWPGLEPGPSALGAQILSHWTTKEVPAHWIFLFKTTALFFGCTLRHVGNLVPRLGIEPWPLQWKRSLNFWTTREVPTLYFSCFSKDFRCRLHPHHRLQTPLEGRRSESETLERVRLCNGLSSSQEASRLIPGGQSYTQGDVQKTPAPGLFHCTCWWLKQQHMCSHGFTVYLWKRPQPSRCGWSTEGRWGSVWDAEPGRPRCPESPGAWSSGGTGHRPHAALRRPGAGLGGDRGPSSGLHPQQYRQGSWVPLIETLVPSAAQIS